MSLAFGKVEFKAGRAFTSYMLMPVVTVATFGVGGIYYIDCDGSRKCDSTRRVTKTITKKVKAEVLISKWGEGKAKILGSFSGKKGCSGFSFSYTGLQESDDAYTLYFPDDRGESIMDPSQKIGELFISKKDVFIHFFEDMIVETQRDNGFSCTWTVDHDAHIILDKK